MVPEPTLGFLRSARSPESSGYRRSEFWGIHLIVPLSHEDYAADTITMGRHVACLLGTGRPAKERATA